MIDSSNHLGSPRWRPSAFAVVMVAGSLLLGLQAATQCLAYFFREDPALGYSFSGGLYPPWSAVVWAMKWNSSSPNAVRIAAGVGVMVIAAMFGVTAYVTALRQFSRNHHTHGSARWASLKDIRRSGLFGTPGDSVYVGAFKDRLGRLRYLQHSGPEHILTFAPTRSGKSIGPVSMTLCSWSESAFVLDLKGELVQTSSGWRKRYAGNKILIYEPAHPNSIGWNPIDEIDVSSPSAVADAQDLSTMKVDPEGRGLPDHWAKTAMSLLTGMILYVLHKHGPGSGSTSFSGIDAELSNPDRSIHDLWAEMASMSEICPVVAASGKDMLDRPEEEAGSVLSTLKSYLSLYRDPVVAKNTSRSDFKVRDLMHHESPVTLYLVTQPSDKARLRPLVRLLLNSVVRKLTGRMEYVAEQPKRSWNPFRPAQPPSVSARAPYKHRLLLLLDEFPALGKLPIMQESLAYLAGYGMKAYILVQDTPQLKSHTQGYGPDETITSNCHIQTAYRPNRIETAEHLSKLTGITTVMREQVTLSGNGLQQRSRVMQEVQRPLLTADEAMRLEGPRKKGGQEGPIVEAGEMLVFVAGVPPIKGTQPISVLDPVFAARRAVPPVVVSDRLGVMHEGSSRQSANNS